MSNRLTVENLCRLIHIDQVDAVLARNRKRVGLLRVPFDRLQPGLVALRWNHAHEELGTVNNQIPTPLMTKQSRTYGTSSSMTLGNSQTTKPPSEVTPASRLPDTTMSITDDVGGKDGGSWRSVRSPLERLIIRTRPRISKF